MLGPCNCVWPMMGWVDLWISVSCRLSDSVLSRCPPVHKLSCHRLVYSNHWSFSLRIWCAHYPWGFNFSDPLAFDLETATLTLKHVAPGVQGIRQLQSPYTVCYIGAHYPWYVPCRCAWICFFFQSLRLLPLKLWPWNWNLCGTSCAQGNLAEVYKFEVHTYKFYQIMGIGESE